jgi:rhamnosyl/mannosyltransferase
VTRVGRIGRINRLEICPNLLLNLKTAMKKADIVHLHTPNPLMLAAWWIVGDRSKTLIVTHHSDVVKQKALNYFVSPIEKRVYFFARRILSDSPNYIEGSKVLKEFQPKVQVLPLGIDLDPYLHPAPRTIENARELKDKMGNPLWLMVGRLTYYKGYETAIDALAKVDGMLVVVGTGELEANLKYQANRKGVSERVIWIPSVSQNELVSLYYAATALWFPSTAKSEGFGLVQVEAMACGCPVINTDIKHSGVSWVSINGKTGLTVPVFDSDKLANAANRIAKEKGLREKFSGGAKARALTEFESKKMVERSLKLYEEVLI